LLVLPWVFGSLEVEAQYFANMEAQGSIVYEAGVQTVNFVQTKSVRLGLLLFVPRQYAERSDWPVIVFLHGAGESGSDPNKVALQGPPRLVQTNPDFPFVVVSPQNSAGRGGFSGTMAAAVAELVELLPRELSTDPRRVYLTGVSMGGFGTWSVASTFPHLFAAIAPICGGGDTSSVVENLKQMPVWVWHGANDVVIPVRESDKLVDALRKARPHHPELVKYTRLEHAPGHDEQWAAAGIPEMPGHASWVPAYKIDSELWNWFLDHSKSE